MRTFIALELSNPIKHELSRLQQELTKSNADVKWVKPENIHLTLKFLGNIDETKLEQIKHILDGISSEEKPFEIHLSELGAFPNLNRPRVLWVGLDKGSSETKQIAAALETELQKIGFPKEERPFSAHLTLGRVKSGKNRDCPHGYPSKGTEKNRDCPPLYPSKWTVPIFQQITHITLFQSELTPRGPIYTSLHEAKFTPLDINI